MFIFMQISIEFYAYFVNMENHKMYLSQLNNHDVAMLLLKTFKFFPRIFFAFFSVCENLMRFFFFPHVIFLS